MEKFLNEERTRELWQTIKSYVNDISGSGNGDTVVPSGPSVKPIIRSVVLLAKDWNENNEQTVFVPGVLADETRQLIQPTPTIGFQSLYYNAGIICVGQDYYSLTFKARKVPTENINIHVVITGAKLAGSFGSRNTFGVVWNYDNDSTALERLSVEADPYGYVTDIVGEEPVPAVGNEGGSSPFDSYMPWSGMQEYNISGTTVMYEYGDADFSRTLYDTMVYIPEFWYKVVDDSSSKKRYFYVSNNESSGFEKHPGSGKYVSRYTANSDYKSISGNLSKVSITRATARTNAKAKGDGWQLYDFASLCAIQMLYLVEFADWDSQKKVGCGLVDSVGDQTNTGSTDDMAYHTGRASGTDGKTAVQYRHIENTWGNLYQFVDGINFSDRKAYICTDPSKYADDTSTGYTNTGITLPSTNGYIKNMGYSIDNSWCLIPNTSGGAENTYIPDHVYSSTNWCILYCGGAYSNASPGGLFSFSGNNTSTHTRPSLGVRLLFTP